MATNKGEVLAYIGTYTTGQAEGIYVYSFDMRSGTFAHVRTVTGIENPTFLVIDPARRCLYAVSELLGGRPGGVVAYSMGSNADDLVELVPFFDLPLQLLHHIGGCLRVCKLGAQVGIWVKNEYPAVHLARHL